MFILGISSRIWRCCFSRSCELLQIFLYRTKLFFNSPYILTTPVSRKLHPMAEVHQVVQIADQKGRQWLLICSRSRQPGIKFKKIIMYCKSMCCRTMPVFSRLHKSQKRGFANIQTTSYVLFVWWLKTHLRKQLSGARQTKITRIRLLPSEIT